MDERPEENGALCGAILVVPRDSDAAASRSRKSYLAEIDRAIDAALAQASEVGTVTDLLIDNLSETVLKRTAQAQAMVVCHVAQFALFRTGELRIWFEDGLFVGRDTTADPLTAAEKLAAEYLPSQMYFFLKDITHRHYHHDPETDQLLKLALLIAAEK
ncbi:MAG: hypothetical protein DI606_13425 [Sphingobium sp.]|uniref:hypothetical protein n=1 Tax=Sphingobium sp. TaxID=1912891 RepID=UPI000DB6CE88|nr:hypothetical protein [Sphingobium sp.]PZU09944.1 MAG: hypothetical protein DI606_13425 [Sphingobium sp.]